MHPNKGESSDQNVPGVCLWLEHPQGSDRGVLTVWIESVPQESGLVCGYHFPVVKCTLWEIRSHDIFRRNFPPTKGNQIQGIRRRNCDNILFKDKVRGNEVALDFHISLSRAFRDPVVCPQGTLDETECTVYSTVYDWWLAVCTLSAWGRGLCIQADGGCAGTSRGDFYLHVHTRHRSGLKRQNHTPLSTGPSVLPPPDSQTLCTTA